MSATIKKRGKYKLCETDRRHRILSLNDDEWYAWVKGQKSEILVLSDSDHDFEKTLSEGNFYLIDFEDDPQFQDTPHLFLQNGGAYETAVLPNGLPTEADEQKRIVPADETLPEEKLKPYLSSQ